MQQPHNNRSGNGRHAGLTYNQGDRYYSVDGDNAGDSRFNNVDGRYSQVDSRYNKFGGEPTQKKSPWRLITCITLGIVVIIGGGAFASPEFRHQILISIVRQPTPYTQLYFPNLGALSGKLEAGKKNTFEFAIENDESHTYSYTYIVTLDDSRSHQVVSKIPLTIGNGEQVTRSVTIVPKDRNSRYLVTIALEGMNQSIHFYGQTS